MAGPYPKQYVFITVDIWAVVDHLIGIKFRICTLDDTNHFKNKRIRSVADLLEDQFGLALVRFKNAIRGTICGAIRHKLIPSPQNLITLDNTHYLNSWKKIELFGPGKLIRRIACFRIHDIHPSHHGHICLVDTSEGINNGLLEQLHFRSIFSFQYFFIGASLIPFIEHNDVNRALMIREVHCWNWVGMLSVPGFKGNGNTISIPLVIYQRSNKYACMHKNPRIPEGKCVNKRQIIVDGATTVGGELALEKIWKKNLLMPQDRLLQAILAIQISTSKETCLKLPIGERIHVYISQKPEIKLSDKVARRHCNQGHIFECSLGLAWSLLDRHY
ncbi:DNA-directed RNA polymerase subunit beta [Bienertia sinuspersici]